MVRVNMHIHDPANRLAARAMLEAAGCAIVESDAQVQVFDDCAEARARCTAAPSLLLCPFDGVAGAVDAMRHGLYGYVLLPFVPGELEIMVHRAADTRAASASASPAPETLNELERQHIRGVLRACKHNQAEAARRLGIGRNTLWRKLKQMNISTDEQGET